jgi:protein-S-isoprenylcysteine O-methyltransferase Ste14
MEHLRLLSWPNILFYLANLLWVLEFVVFRNRQTKGRFKENRSFWFLTLTLVITIVLTIQLSRLDLGTTDESMIYPWFQTLGLVFYAIGLFLRYQGSVVLGQHFTRHVAVSQQMELRSHGPYRYLRHPLYLGLWLIALAFPLYVGNWLALLIVTPMTFIALLRRMAIEEAALLKLNPHYAEWRKTRYRIIPFIY